MKTTVFILLTFLLIALSIMPAYAAGKATAQKQITGTVTGIDRASKTITVTKKDKDVVLNIEGKTNIVQCTDDNDISDIKIGDRVTVQYQDKEDENTAKTITIKNTTP